MAHPKRIQRVPCNKSACQALSVKPFGPEEKCGKLFDEVVVCIKGNIGLVPNQEPSCRIDTLRAVNSQQVKRTILQWFTSKMGGQLPVVQQLG